MSNDIYTAPKSDLLDGQLEKPQRSIFWKIYFVFITLLYVLGMAFTFFDKNAGVAEVISVLLLLLSLLAVFGYVFTRKFLSGKFWRYFFFVYIVWSIMYYWITQVDLAAGLNQQEFIISQAISWTISIPFYVALFLYGRSPYLFGDKT